jgi:TonB family protein
MTGYCIQLSCSVLGRYRPLYCGLKTEDFRIRITSVTCRLLPLYLPCFCMGYAALLFCPEEKTARTVTQVLSELEFGVESSIEPFQAVKKLMSQHFDAVVVDCDNEQNATLIFKSARNSRQNQASLAVAVVEGQAGVAKAFRIGANLVLTKPINIEQAKGTLRVARGLLRKAEPAKPSAGTAVSAPATAATPFLSSSGRSIPPVKQRTTSVAIKPTNRDPETAPVPDIAATPAWPTQKVASSSPGAQDDDVLEIASSSSSSSSAITTLFASGAASAPAPARESADSHAQKTPTTSASDADDILEKHSDGVLHSPAGTAPLFTLGGIEDSDEAKGGVKKIFLVVAAAVIVLVALYAAWAHFHTAPARGDSTEPTPAPATTQPAVPAPMKPTSDQPSSQVPPASSLLAKPEPGKSIAQETSDLGSEQDASYARNKSAVPEPSVTPLVVEGGKAPSTKKAPAADAPPPTMEGIDASSAAAPLPNLGTSDAIAPKPVLGTLNISQGVSRGLLIKKVQPVYPRSALSAGIEGTVELQATISKTGEITKVKVLSGEHELTKAATDAVSQWKYKPYLLNGEPVEITTQVTINFKLPN